MSKNVGLVLPCFFSTRPIHLSTSLKRVSPKKSNFKNPFGSKFLTFIPSDQGVCNSPLTDIIGIQLVRSFSGAIITPPACLPMLLFCKNKELICLSTSGYFSMNVLYLFEYAMQSSCLSINIDFSSLSPRA